MLSPLVTALSNPHSVRPARHDLDLISSCRENTWMQPPQPLIAALDDVCIFSCTQCAIRGAARRWLEHYERATISLLGSKHQGWDAGAVEEEYVRPHSACKRFPVLRPDRSVLR